MPKVKTYPWDAADHIETAEDAILFLKISLEDYDSTFNALMDCIARSKGVAEIASLVCHEAGDGNRSITITTISGAETTIAIAPEVDVDSIRRAFTPAPAPASP
ncbi:MAG: hypothetical protein F4X64_18740 [Chloroflexi bacterium]|nr:hypothetical protein [Chloroflexota bacterium]